MHKVLNEIIVSTKREVASRKSKIRVDTLGVEPRNEAELLVECHNKSSFFKQSILKPKVGDIALIAEIKIASPSAGQIGKVEDIFKKVKEYEKIGADAISIITEKNYFKGYLELVTEVKQKVALPILQKDFIVMEFQIHEAKRLGSDALLLITRIVDQTTLEEFVTLCFKLGLEPVVEINSEEDLEKAIKTQTKIIAVNARDLDSFEVNLNKACKLMQKIPEKFIKLGFSGIVSRKEVEEYKAVGAKAVLVGTQLMKSDNVERLIKELKNVS